MILVSGAAGKTGRAIMAALAAKGAQTRAFIFRTEQAGDAGAVGASETIAGDMHDAGTWEAAVAGATAIYHICPNMHPDEVAIARTAIAAASAAGVHRFVYHSVLHPQTQAMPHHWRKLDVEGMLFESGLEFTILQPAAYMQNLLGAWKAITEQGVYRVPYPVDTRISIVDLEDIAAVAARVLVEPDHASAIYELAGPENLSQSEVAATLGLHLGRPVRAEEIPLATWKQQAEAAGLGDQQIETLVQMFRYYANFGFCGNSGVLGWLLQRPPTTFAEFVQRHSAFRRIDSQPR